MDVAVEKGFATMGRMMEAKAANDDVAMTSLRAVLAVEDGTCCYCDYYVQNRSARTRLRRIGSRSRSRAHVASIHRRLRDIAEKESAEYKARMVCTVLYRCSY